MSAEELEEWNSEECEFRWITTLVTRENHLVQRPYSRVSQSSPTPYNRSGHMYVWLDDLRHLCYWKNDAIVVHCGKRSRVTDIDRRICPNDTSEHGIKLESRQTTTKGKPPLEYYSLNLIACGSEHG